MKSNLTSKKTRNSSIELLRILAMFFVVLSHYSVHGQLEAVDLPLSFNRILLDITVTGNLGVDIFIIISGFFLINSKFKLNKLIKLIGQVLFYSIIIYLIFVLTGLKQFDLFDFACSLLPITTKQYWFVTVYVTLYLLHPFINIFLKNINKKQHIIFFSIIIFIWSIIPTMGSRFDFYGNEFAQFVMLYSIGAYFQLYPINTKKEKTLSIILIVANILICIFIMFLEYRISLIRIIGVDNCGRSSIFIILLASGLFLIFKNLKIKDSNIINTITKCTFGVYLIHDNNYVREWLWNDVFPNSSYVNTNKLALHLISSVIIIYVVCTAIDYIRITLFEKPVFKLLNKPIDSVEIKLKTAFDEVYKKIDELLYGNM